MRLDRLLTLYLFGPLARLRKPRGLRIPILMYHSISDDPETGHPYYWINTSPACFAEHMKFLYDNGYQVIPLSTAVEMIRMEKTNSKILNFNLEPRTSNLEPGSNLEPRTSNPEKGLTNKPNKLNELNNPIDPINQPTNQSDQLNGLDRPNQQNRPNELKEPEEPNELNQPNRLKEPEKPRYVVLTFDDGYLDFYTEAFPILQQYGFHATVFLPTIFIDGKRPGLRGKEHLNWDQVRELRTVGITIGSHTCSHPQLYDLPLDKIEQELHRSKESIEFHLNQTTNKEVKQSAQSTNKPNKLNESYELSAMSYKPFPPDHPITLSSVDSFCYPYKFPGQNKAFRTLLSDSLKKTGYNNCVTTRIGSYNTAEDILCMKRLPMNRADDHWLFRAKLQGGYDWLACLQSLTKKTNRGSRVGRPVGQMIEKVQTKAGVRA